MRGVSLVEDVFVFGVRNEELADLRCSGVGRLIVLGSVYNLGVRIGPRLVE